MTEEIGKSEEFPQNSQRFTGDRSMREGERPFFIEEMCQGTQHQKTNQPSQSYSPCSPGAANPGKVDDVVLCK